MADKVAIRDTQSKPNALAIGTTGTRETKDEIHELDEAEAAPFWTFDGDMIFFNSLQ